MKRETEKMLNIVELAYMQLDVGTLVTLLTIIGTQIGSTTALSILYRQIVKRLDKLNGRVSDQEKAHSELASDVQEDLREHVEKFHVKK